MPLVVRRLRGPEPVRAIHAAVRETSLPQPALRGLIDALRDVARGTTVGAAEPARR